MIIGNDEYRYQWDGDWARLPAGKAFGYTHGVAFDRAGQVYIHNQSPDAVCIFTPDGDFVDSWGEGFAAGAHGLLLNDEDGVEYLYLTDYVQHAVVKTTLTGEEVLRLPMPDRPDLYADAGEYKPTECAVGPNGDIYVADGYGKSWIHRYDRDGNYLASFGGPGEELGRLRCPHALRVDRRGDEPVLLVADRANVRLQAFSLEGEPLGARLTADLRYPCNVSFWEGHLLVPDLRSRVSLFDPADRLIAHLGDNPGQWQKEGWPNLPADQFQPGLCSSPHHAEFDRDGNIYVVEWVATGRVTKLTRV